MQYYRCKCGKNEAWGSMSPPACFGCDNCGTNITLHWISPKQPKPHKFIITKVETDEGLKPLSRCKYCHKTIYELKIK